MSNEKEQDQLMFEFIDDLDKVQEWNPTGLDNSQGEQVERNAEGD